ncbi:hypothetical protein D3C85_1025100 [compost metagenome]
MRLQLAFGFQLQAQFAEYRAESLGFGLDHQQVIDAQDMSWVGRGQAQVVAQHADHLGVGLVEQLLDFAQGLAGRLGSRLDPRLGEVSAGVEAGGAGDLALGYQAPAEQGDEQHPCQCHRDANRAEVEHGKGPGPALRAEAGDDQVGRRADQRGHAAENGAESQRHQHPAGRQCLFPGDLQGNRHQQGERPDIVHEGREQRTEAGQCGNRQHRPGIGGQHALGQRIDHPGHLQAVAQHQHAGDGDHRRVAETAEGLLVRHQPGQHAGQQGAEGDHVVTPATPDEQPDGGDEDGEEQALVLGHTRERSLDERGGAPLGHGRVGLLLTL